MHGTGVASTQRHCQTITTNQGVHMRTVIIGGGVLGLTLGYELARQGAEVEIVDARESGLGASAVNAGWVVPSGQ